MRLDLRFSNRPLEELWCQAVALLVFERPAMDDDVLSSLNRKMTGFLQNLLYEDRLTGSRGENLLLATQSSIKADKLLLHGIGSSSQLDEEILKHEIVDLGIRLDRIDVNELGIHIPFNHGMKTEYDSCLEISAINLLECYFDRHEHDPEFILKVIFSIKTEYMEVLEPVIKRLRGYFESRLDYSIIVDNKNQVRSENDSSTLIEERN